MKAINLTEGSITGNIRRFAVPYMLAYFLQILYGLADLFVVGQYCGVDAITAVSNSGQVMYLITAVLIGLAMGTTVEIGHGVGANDRRRTARAIGNTVTVFLIIAIVLGATLLSLRHTIVAAIDTPAEAVEGSVDYLTVCFIGVPFIIGFNILASIFRGLGDSRSPMIFVAVACAVNIGLDYLLIGGLGMGAMGAALGTTLSQMTSVVVAIVAIRRRGLFPPISRADFRIDRRTAGRILKVGTPIALQDGFIQVSFIAITVIANNRGLLDAAAVGIVEKLIGLLFIVPSAMLASVSAISSQCIGANRMGRAITTMKYAIAIAAGFGLCAATILQFIPDLAMRIFTQDEGVVALGAEYLRGYSWDCALAGVHFCFSGLFTACGLSIVSFVHNVISIVTARVPLAYLASIKFPDTLYPMGLATCAGSVVSIVICLIAYRWLWQHHRIHS